MSIIKTKLSDREYATSHTHTYETSFMKTGGWVLDLGCNDFILARYFINLGFKVIGLDPIKNINIPTDLRNNKNFIYLQKACVGVKDSETKTYYEYNAWGANSIYNKPELLHRPENSGHADNPLKDFYEVGLVTITELMQTYGIDQFEYIKIDTEGAEYSILENFPKNCTKQFSVEFHDFLDLTPIKDVEQYHKELNNKLTDYVITYEEKEPLKGSDIAYQRNDILYVSKSLL